MLASHHQEGKSQTFIDFLLLLSSESSIIILSALTGIALFVIAAISHATLSCIASTSVQLQDTQIAAQVELSKQVYSIFATISSHLLHITNHAVVSSFTHGATTLS